MEQYEIIQKIGEGAYGKVYKAMDKSTGQLVAVKKTVIESDEGVPPTTIREISLLQMIGKCPNVVNLLAVEQTEDSSGREESLFLIFEYMDYDLKKYMAAGREDGDRPALAPSLVRDFMFQLCRGVAHLHSHGIMHRDLKPQNLLIDDRRQVLKIADLGLSRAFSIPLRAYSHEIVTLWYRAPEVLLGGKHYSTPVDIWSVGCIFAELVRGEPLFTGDSEIQQLLCIFKLLGTPTEESWKGITKYKDWHEFPNWKRTDLQPIMQPFLTAEGIQLLDFMLQFDPAKRVSAAEALVHPYFDSVE